MAPSPERRAQILAQCEEHSIAAARRIGASAWYEHGHKVLTEDEQSEIASAWERGSWTDTFLTWIGPGPVPRGGPIS